MKKALKKILFFTDDITQEDLKIVYGDGNYFYDKKSNWCCFKFHKIESFKEVDRRRKYDAVLIDFGLLDNSEEEENIRVLQRFNSIGVPLAYIGGLPTYYNSQARKLFPKQKFLHNLPSSSLRELLYILYTILKKPHH